MQKARRHPFRTPTACKCMVSGTISPPYSGYFSSFPHGTSSLSVSNEYLALPDGAGRFRRGFTGPALLRILPQITSYLYGTITLYGLNFHSVLVSVSSIMESYNPYHAVTR